MKIKIDYKDIESSEDWLVKKMIINMWLDGYDKHGDFKTMEEACEDIELRDWCSDQLRKTFQAEVEIPGDIY